MPGCVGTESVQRWRVHLGRRESRAGSDVGESHQRMHDRQLARMIELEARDALAVGQYGRLSQFPQLAAVYERLQEVLLGVVIVVDDLGHPLRSCGRFSTFLLTP